MFHKSKEWVVPLDSPPYGAYDLTPGQAFYFTLFDLPAGNPDNVRIVQDSTGGAGTEMQLTNVQVFEIGNFDADPQLEVNTLDNFVTSGTDLDLNLDAYAGKFIALRVRIDPKSLVTRNDPGSSVTNDFTTFLGAVEVDSDSNGVPLNRVVG